jgi:hypothetical protein
MESLANRISIQFGDGLNLSKLAWVEKRSEKGEDNLVEVLEKISQPVHEKLLEEEIVGAVNENSFICDFSKIDIL